MPSSVPADRRARAAAALAVAALAGCAGRAAAARAPAGAAPGEPRVTLYRDAALVERLVALPPADGRAAASVPADVDLDRLRAVAVDAADGPVRVALEAGRGGPGRRVRLVGRPGARVALAYLTRSLPWSAAYTLALDAGGARGVLDGVLALDVPAGLDLPAARVRLIDAGLAVWTGQPGAGLAAALAGAAPGRGRVIAPRELGLVALDGAGPGAGGAPSARRRLPLLAPTARRLRAVVLYDAVGPGLDVTLGPFAADPRYGATAPSRTDLDEAVELDLPAGAAAELPAGPVAVVDAGAAPRRREAGRLFEAAVRGPATATIATGRAARVTARRARRDVTPDPRARRLTEEFVVEVENQRSRPIQVVVREHLYRGPTWVLPYDSTRAARIEAPQQLRFPLAVPAGGRARLLYVVRYTSDAPAPAHPEEP